LGIDEKGYFYHEIQKINDGGFGTIKLNPPSARDSSLADGIAGYVRSGFSHLK
jgi:hypothetical protein